jgi:hypothetical protein
LALASYVLLIKEKENEAEVIYRFGPDESKMGLIRLDKKTKRFSELAVVPDLSQSSVFYFDRAAQKLAKCFTEGEFPDKTAFYS